jgi:hypothetical protein
MDIGTQIRQALARGYCTPENKHKELDAVLIEAMEKEIIKSLFPDYNTMLSVSGERGEHNE